MATKTLKDEIMSGSHFGVAVLGNSPAITELAGLCGYHFCWLEVEHGPADWALIENLCRAAELRGLWTLVRVPGGDRQSVLRALEVGGRIIVTPMINTAQEAAKVAEYGKCPPTGLRGFNLGSRGMGYGMKTCLQAHTDANAGTVLLVQIETAQAVENGEAIVSVPGVDGILVGPGDLSQSMGITAQWDNPKLMDTVVNVFRIAQRHKKITATVCPTLDMGRRWIEVGVNLINVGSDIGMIRTTMLQTLDTYRKM